MFKVAVRALSLLSAVLFIERRDTHLCVHLRAQHVSIARHCSGTSAQAFHKLIVVRAGSTK
jgi:hypothetical protein